MSEFRMPSLGADMEYGTLVEWYIEPGSTVRRGQVIGLVDTHKGAIEIEVFEEGVVEELLTRPGERVAVGTVMARVGAGGGAPATVAGAAPHVSTAAASVRAEPAEVRELPSVGLHSPARQETRAPLRGTGPGGAITLEDVRGVSHAAVAPPSIPASEAGPRTRTTPIARRMAEEHDVDLTRVQGTGARGAIVKADVERALSALRQPLRPTSIELAVAPAPEPEAPAAARVARERTTAMRQAIAAAVSRSKREIPHYYLATRVDMGPALAWLATTNQGRPAQDLVLPAAVQLRAVALALREFPDFNGFWIDGALRPGDGVHLGVAVSLRGGGLVVPAIHHADRLDIDALMRALSDIVTRARGGRLRGSEVTDATITVTNLGERGVETVFGVIYPPQVALVGFGRIEDRAWAQDDMLGVRPVVTVTLAADHRASDGHRGSLFLSAIARGLAQPELS